ncbi:MAG: hypothetical protein Q8N99_00390 [Nanoarchaeota archaeon]|nr:hypothetical protein [Nanoarchaeota archaeon]
MQQKFKMNENTKTIEELKSKGEYQTNKRTREELENIGRKFVKTIADGFGGFDSRINKIYIGEESKFDTPSEKLPNMTLFWNLQFANKGFMHASSMGHLHPPENFEVQEIYEFQGYGGMFIYEEGKRAKFYVCKPKDKVPVPPNCFMTILNLSHLELLTLDIANPSTNKSSKVEIKSKKGPMIAIYNLGDSSKTEERDFSDSDYKAPINIGGTVRIALNPEYSFNIDNTATIELRTEEKESGLYEALIEKRDDFTKYNMEILTASPYLRIKGRDSKYYYLNRSLLELVLDKKMPVHRLLGII